MTDIHMSKTDFAALTDARDYTQRALAAARASRPIDSVAMAALDRVREQLTNSARMLDAIKARARVTP
jgi:hypothetical protein